MWPFKRKRKVEIREFDIEYRGRPKRILHVKLKGKVTSKDIAHMKKIITRGLKNSKKRRQDMFLISNDNIEVKFVKK